MYSIGVAIKPGVLCKVCGKGIEIDDDYLPGIRGAEMAASLYARFPESAQGRVVDSAIRPWQKTLTCENPDCGRTFTYTAEDLRMYEE